MSNERERLAREWAKYAKKREVSSPEEQAAAEHIMATTTEPRMDEVVWDDEKHLGAGATDTNGTVWVMSQNDGDYINCIGLDLSTCGALAEELTPNGKRYELREVTDGEHPETLTTEEDYENAPEGTVVAEPRWQAWQKRATGKWVYAESKRDSGSIAGTERRVLRWGWGE